MGCSAGAMGAQLWNDIVLTDLNYEQAGVMSDSYLGVFPEGVEGDLIYDFGYCETPLVPTSLYTTCINKLLTFEDIMMNAFTIHVDVPFGYIQSKVDSIQHLFYILLGAPSDQNVTRSEFYYYSNMLLQNFNINDNVAVYLVDGATHCFTNRNFYFSADTCGSNVNGTEPTCQQESTVQWLWDWTNSIPFPPESSGTYASLQTSCTGELIYPDISSNDTTYCDTNLIPKTVTNGVPIDTFGSDDDDNDVAQTMAIAVSVVVGGIFIIVVLYWYFASKNKMGAAEPFSAESSKEQYKRVSEAYMRSSLLTPSEQECVKSDDLLIETRSRLNSTESVEI